MGCLVCVCVCVYKLACGSALKRQMSDPERNRIEREESGPAPAESLGVGGGRESEIAAEWHMYN